MLESSLSISGAEEEEPGLYACVCVVRTEIARREGGREGERERRRGVDMITKGGWRPGRGGEGRGGEGKV